VRAPRSYARTPSRAVVAPLRYALWLYSRRCQRVRTGMADAGAKSCCVLRRSSFFVFSAGQFRVSPPLTTESPTTHYCTVQHHVPIDPYAERSNGCRVQTAVLFRVSPSCTLRGVRAAAGL
jgi:hypothetical protein